VDPVKSLQFVLMDDDDVILIVVLACIAAVHQLITAVSILFDDVPTVKEKWLLKKHQHELTPLQNECFCLILHPSNSFEAAELSSRSSTRQ
jgi:hypothetical protein